MVARVFIGVPNTGRVAAETVASLRRVAERTAAMAEVVVRHVTAAPVDAARHALVEAFLQERSATHLFFIDSDMGLPGDALLRLLAVDRPIACLPCPILVPDGPSGASVGVTTNIWMLHSSENLPEAERIVRYLEPDEFPSAPFTCYGTGLACCLIRREVFQGMTLPYFAIQYGADWSQPRIGEDAFFFNKARAAGFSITVDPGSICDHFKEVDVTRLEELMGGVAPTPELGVDTGPAPAVAVVSEDGQIHRSQAAWLAGVRQPDLFLSPSGSFDRGLRDSLRWFLREARSERLVLFDGRTVSPADVSAWGIQPDSPWATGFFREVDGPEIGPGLWARDAAGTLRRASEPEAAPIVAASLRATRLDRSLIERIGLGWIRRHGGPVEQGFALAEALTKLGMDGPAILPLRCSHYATVGLRSLLEVKTRSRAKWRSSPMPRSVS